MQTLISNLPIAPVREQIARRLDLEIRATNTPAVLAELDLVRQRIAHGTEFEFAFTPDSGHSFNLFDVQGYFVTAPIVSNGHSGRCFKCGQPLLGTLSVSGVFTDCTIHIACLIDTYERYIREALRYAAPA